MSNFKNYLEATIQNQMMLGGARNDAILTGARNLKSDYDYMMSKSSTKDENEVVIKLYKERIENAEIYRDTNQELFLQENVEANMIKPYVPKEPSEQEVMEFLGTLDIDKNMKNFKVFIEKCQENFGMKVDSKYIQNFIKG